MPPRSSHPGSDLVTAGLADLAARRHSVEALLVARAAARLRDCGTAVPEHEVADPDRRLYALLAARDPDGAHSTYNALTRRVVSYCRSMEHAGRR